MKIVNIKKKKMKLFAKEQQESCENAKTCYICKEKVKTIYLKEKKYCKVGYDLLYTGEYRGTVHGICDLKYSVPKKIHSIISKFNNFS